MKRMVLALLVLLAGLSPAYAQHNWPERSEALLVCQERIEGLTTAMNEVYARLYYLKNSSSSDVVDSLFVHNFRVAHESDLFAVIEMMRWNAYQDSTGAEECIRISEEYWAYMHNIVSDIPDFLR